MYVTPKISQGPPPSTVNLYLVIKKKFYEEVIPL